jgi:hypothetical protein
MRTFAYTAPFGIKPEYINVQGMENGSTILMVRSQGTDTIAKINLPPDQCRALGQALLDRAAEFE